MSWGEVGIARLGSLTVQAIHRMPDGLRFYAPLGVPPPTRDDPRPGWIPDEGDLLRLIRDLRRAAREVPK